MQKPGSTGSTATYGSQGSLYTFRLGDINLGDYLLMAAQLGLFYLVVHLFRIEETFGFAKIAPIIVGGSLVHALLPMRFRMPFFLFLSLGALFAVLGPTPAAILIGIGLAMIGTCHLPIAMWMRVAILLGITTVLGLYRSDIIPSEWSVLVMPILGSIFMFRLVVYLYDLKNEKPGTSIWTRLSYFFLLPNVCFPLFPVVDYLMFKRTYYNEKPATIYQQGLLWMMRGSVQLILYRVVYTHLLIPPEQVEGLWTLVQAILTTYLLYLRISGQFHLIVGILCLFGMNLPETHHLYYLASSFSDYWRRINIYWKDFMMKIFFYPSFIRLRKFGTTTALVIATSIVFLMTWILHSYQWYWLQAAFPITVPDGLFWAILGLVVVINSLREIKNPPKKALGKKEWSLRDATVHSAKVVGMFVFISFLWYLWSSESIDNFVTAVMAAGSEPISAYLLLIGGLAGLVVIGVFLQFAATRNWLSHPGAVDGSIVKTALYCLSAYLVLITVDNQAFKSRISEESVAFVESLQQEGFNKHDQTQFERGYYESLLTTNKYTSALWQNNMNKPAGWVGIQDSDAVQPTSDLRLYELKPSFQTTLKEAPLTTNQYGLRDQEYPMDKPDNTYRIALLGTSYIMGSGVDDSQKVDALVEDKLNKRGDTLNYEILNFAVGGYGLLQQVEVVAKRVLDFKPDALFYVVQPSEVERTYLRLLKPIKEGVEIEYDGLKQIIEESGLDPDEGSRQFIQYLEPYGEDLVQWAYDDIVARCEALGITPVMVFLPQTMRPFQPGEIEQLTEMGRKAGFTHTLDLNDVYEDIEMNDIMLAPWDFHPNAAGQRLIGSHLYDALVASDLFKSIQPSVQTADAEPAQ